MSMAIDTLPARAAAAARRAGALALLALAWTTAAAAAESSASESGDDTVHLAVRLVKQVPEPGVPVLQAGSCRPCRQGRDPDFQKDNPRETVLDLHVPRLRPLQLRFDGAGTRYRRALLGYDELVLRREGEALVLELPPQAADRTDAAELSTRIVEPGLSLRLEHDDPPRRDGDYRGLRGAMRGKIAANQLEFAMREAVRQLGVGEKVQREQLGLIHIMGFDTNNPGGHRDAPAHVHMHLRWPDVAGTQIGHYYLDERGLLTRNRVSYQRLGAPDRVFEPGQTFTTVDRYGRAAYAHTIGKDGSLTLADGDGRACAITPLQSGQGFDTGARVACAGAKAIAVRVDDDPGRGVLRVDVDGLVETWRYDPDSGRLLP